MPLLELFDYQKEGAKWLASKQFALLADKQRLGKSAQAITAAELIGAKKILVICKAIGRINWTWEFDKFANSNWAYNVLYGTKFGQITPQDYSVTIASYEATDILLANLVGTFDLIIVDESHSLKSLDAQRTQNILGKNGLSRRTKRIWLLTGTPAPNHAGELWTTLYTFGATKLPYQEFIEKYCRIQDSGFGSRITGTKTDIATIQELRQTMKPVVLRRTEQDVSIEMPKLHFSTVMVEAGRVHLASTSLARFVLPYDRTDDLNKIIQEEMGIVKAVLKDKTLSPEFFEVLKAEAKSVSTLRRFTGLQKLDAAFELISEELRSNAYPKCVIFAHHKDIIQGVQARLHEFHPVTMYGGSNPKKVEFNLKRFANMQSQCRVFIGNIAAAGTSISLSSANHIFFMEQSWTPGDNAQAMMRCGGPQQKKPIFVRNFCLNDSIDKRIEQILMNKSKEIAKIFNDQDQELLELL